MSLARRILKTANRAIEHSLRVLPQSAAPSGAPAPPARKVLMVKLVGMGDAVIMRSIIEHLRRERPDLAVGVLAGPSTRAVLETLPDVTVHTFDPAGDDVTPRRAYEKVREIRRASYDAVIDFEQHLVLVAAFLALTGIPERIGLAAADNPRSRFQTRTVRLTGDESMWNAYGDLVRTLAPTLTCDTASPLPVPAPVAEWVKQWWFQHGLANSGRVAAFHLGCGTSAVARRWPVSRFLDLAGRLAESHAADVFVLTGTRAESPLAVEFAWQSPYAVVDATWLPSLLHTAEIVRRCALAVSNDTGVMHLAAAMGTPTIGLFGPNSAKRYAPVGPSAVAVERTRLACSPCIHIHRGIVPECRHVRKGQCLRDIPSSHVADVALGLIGGRSDRRLA